jgi:hypothetical protein
MVYETAPTVRKQEMRFHGGAVGPPVEVPAESPLAVSLREAAIVILPYSDAGEATGKFPAGTEPLFQRLRQSLPNRVIELAASDEDYRELVLHSVELVVATIWVAEHVLGATVIDVVANLLAEKVRSAFSGEKKVQSVKAKLLVAQNGGICEFEYEGPAETYRTTMHELLRANALPPAE